MDTACVIAPAKDTVISPGMEILINIFKHAAEEHRCPNGFSNTDVDLPLPAVKLRIENKENER